MQRLPGYRRAAPGLEWRLLRALPWIAPGGFAAIGGARELARRLPPDLSAAEMPLWLNRLDYLALGAVAVWLSALLVLFFACLIVWLMKGPAYVADGYPLCDREQPAPLQPLKPPSAP